MSSSPEPPSGESPRKGLLASYSMAGPGFQTSTSNPDSDATDAHDARGTATEQGKKAAVAPAGRKLKERKRAALAIPRWYIPQHQLEKLEAIFEHNEYPSFALREQLATDELWQQAKELLERAGMMTCAHAHTYTYTYTLAA